MSANNELLNSAMESIVDYNVGNEENYFKEDLTDEERRDKTLFTDKLELSMYYNYIILSCRGDEGAINKWIDYVWDLIQEEQEEAEEEE